jgi:hypothetical protein
MKRGEAKQITKKFKKRRKEERNKKELERALSLEPLDPVRPQCMLYVVLKEAKCVYLPSSAHSSKKIIQRVQKGREHFKLFIAQELQKYRHHTRVILKRNSESLFLPHKLSMWEK